MFKRLKLVVIIFLFFSFGNVWGFEYNTASHHRVKRVWLPKYTTVVVDAKYNLMWEIKSYNIFSDHHKDKLFTWEEAFAYAEALNAEKHAGRNDWRLPTAQELATLVDLGVGHPTIDTDAFPENGNYYYWTRSEWPAYPSMAAYTNFINGNQFKWGKKGKMRVRCVCGGGFKTARADAPGDFAANDLVVIDKVTGLMWEQKTYNPPNAEYQKPIQLSLAKCQTFDIYELLNKISIDEFIKISFFRGQPLSNILMVMSDLSNDYSNAPDAFWPFASDLLNEESETTSMLDMRSALRVYTHAEALRYIDFLNSIKLAGYDDWRLPSAAEMATIIDRYRQPTVKEVFDPTTNWLWWTDTLDPDRKNYYFACSIGGVISNSAQDDSPFCVRAVRGIIHDPIQLEPIVIGHRF